MIYRHQKLLSAEAAASAAVRATTTITFDFYRVLKREVFQIAITTLSIGFLTPNQ